jgi:phage head maturation protease
MENGDIIVTRTILGIGKLYDVSAVSFPANPYTDISARSKDLIDGEIERFEAERLHEAEIKESRMALKEQISRILEENTND